MEINVRDDSRIVEIWLSRQERQDEALRERLRPLYREYADRKYLVAVYQSGEEDLWEQTSRLLCYNRRRVAQIEAEREKQSSLTMDPDSFRRSVSRPDIRRDRDGHREPGSSRCPFSNFCPGPLLHIVPVSADNNIRF